VEKPKSAQHLQDINASKRIVSHLTCMNAKLEMQKDKLLEAQAIDQRKLKKKSMESRKLHAEIKRLQRILYGIKKAKSQRISRSVQTGLKDKRVSSPKSMHFLHEAGEMSLRLKSQDLQLPLLHPPSRDNKPRHLTVDYHSDSESVRTCMRRRREKRKRRPTHSYDLPLVYSEEVQFKTSQESRDFPFVTKSQDFSVQRHDEARLQKENYNLSRLNKRMSNERQSFQNKVEALKSKVGTLSEEVAHLKMNVKHLEFDKKRLSLRNA